MISTRSTSTNVAGRGNEASISCDQEISEGSQREANFNLYKKCLDPAAMLQLMEGRVQ